MFNIYNIVFYKVNSGSYAATTIKKMQRQKLVRSRNEFEEVYGEILNERCTFDGAYNDIISDAYKSLVPRFSAGVFVFFTTEDTLWVCSEEEGYYGAKWYVTAILIAYVMSQHCENYANIKKLGVVYDESIFKKKRGSYQIETIAAEDLSGKVLSNVCRDCVGYITPQDIHKWKESYGTNQNKLNSLCLYYKNILPDDVLFSYNVNIPEVKKIETEQLNPTALVEQKTVNALQAVRAEETAFCDEYFNKKSVFYISDIHLEHHIDFEKPIKPQIRKICEQLADSWNQDRIILIAGDTGTDPELCKMFYHTLKMTFAYRDFKFQVKYRHLCPVDPALTKEKATKQIERKELVLQHNLEALQKRLKRTAKHFKYRGDYKNLYDTSGKLKNQKYAVVAREYEKMKKLQDRLGRIQNNRKKYIEDLQHELKISVKYPEIVVVLGNHELSAFDTVTEGVTFYRDFFEKENIHFLHNGVLKMNGFHIVGGVGFAKYNEQYNADNVVGPRAMKRSDEIKESEMFYEVYSKALSDAVLKDKPLLVLSHYPVRDWLPDNKTSSFCFYFCGHDHHNTFIRTNRLNIYADNQVGYKRTEYYFKLFSFGTIRNPFIDYEDGCYEIAPVQYEKFSKYIGKNLHGTYHIDTALASGTAKFYMIKLVGYYGFFIIDEDRGAKICYGAMTKSIKNSKGRTIDYFFQRFIAMIKAQVGAFGGYNKALKALQSEVRKCGFSGNIHGSIVDVNYYHHIMLNPLDGTITYYYSPTFGIVKPYGTFGDMLKDSLKPQIGESEYEKAFAEYEALNKKNALITKSSVDIGESKQQEVSRKDGMYGVSRKMNQFQKLFDSNMLCVWDDSFLKGTPFEIEDHGV